MKPIIIYSMGRTKSTATLEAARRPVKMHEPFEIYNLDGIKNPNDIDSLINVRDALIETINWPALRTRLEQRNTASKFFGTSLCNYPTARYWFADIDREQTCEIFSLIRNPRDMIWSLLLALRFGFNKINEADPHEVSFSSSDLQIAQFGIDSFLRYYPTNGKLVTFETLPIEFFDVSKVRIQPQNSQSTKMQYVQNVDYVEDQIHKLLKYHSRDWMDKTGTDIFTVT